LSRILLNIGFARNGLKYSKPYIYGYTQVHSRKHNKNNNVVLTCYLVDEYLICHDWTIKL